MPDLLLELFSEEIPARMQMQAAADLRRLVTDALVERGLLYEGAVAHATPRRLALHVAGLPARQQDRHEERKGPRVGAPQAAIDGFLKSAGLASTEEAQVVNDPKKGSFYVARIEKPGAATMDVLAEILPAIIRAFPWPKSMRWGPASVRSDALRWVRPLHSILATFGPESEEPDIVPFAVDGIEAGNMTWGHRFMAPAPLKVRRFDDYAPALEAAKVVVDAARRRDIILHDARDLAFAKGLELVEDEGLLQEVAGLVEWPVVLMGGFDEASLAIPPEVIRATIRVNQKCFVLRSPSPRLREEGGAQSATDEGQTSERGAAPHPGERPLGGLGADPLPVETGRGSSLAPHFILVSNIEASDGGAAIVRGNERVVAARLSDAKFFWDSDLKVPLESRLPKLDAIVFHEKLGTQGERVGRIAALARELAPLVGADPNLAERAAMLAKADLVSEMVGEFPELQGVMGRYYATAQGEDASVAAAIEDHYRPQGPSDRVPTDPVAVALALADKFDTLVGFWAIGEKPTGSKDPYALRRAALGVIRIVIENGLRISVRESASENYLEHLLRLQHGDRIIFLKEKLKPGEVADPHRMSYISITNTFTDDARFYAAVDKTSDVFVCRDPEGRSRNTEHSLIGTVRLQGYEVLQKLPSPEVLTVDLLSFFADRLKVYLRDKGARHDLIDAAMRATPLTPTPDPFPQGEGEQGAAVPPQAADDALARNLAVQGAASVTPTPNPSPQGGGGQGGPVADSAANDDLLLIVRRVVALGRLLDTEDGQNLLTGYRRAANILRAEEKKDGPGAFDRSIDPALLTQNEERMLAQAIERARSEVADLLAHEDFAGAMQSLAALRAPVDDFFDRVTVNAPDPALRLNRLRLLARLRAAMHGIADFSRIAGPATA